MTPNSFSTLLLPLKTSYPATTRHYLISSTFMPPPLIAKQSSHANNPWFTSYIQAFKTFRRHLEHVYKRTTDPASRAEALANLKSATHRYHKLVIAAKQKYYSSLIHSSSSNPRHLWRAVNSLLHRKSPYPLPSSIPSPVSDLPGAQGVGPPCFFF